MKQLFTCLVLCTTLSAYAQPIDKDVISSAGGSVAIPSADLSVHWSLGELATTTIGQNDLILTQGLHQLDALIDPIFTWPSSDNRISIFPNPTPDALHLQQVGSNSFEVELRNLLGQSILVTHWDSAELILRISDLPNQTYLLTLRGAGTFSTFKIVKS